MDGRHWIRFLIKGNYQISVWHTVNQYICLIPLFSNLNIFSSTTNVYPSFMSQQTWGIMIKIRDRDRTQVQLIAVQCMAQFAWLWVYIKNLQICMQYLSCIWRPFSHFCRNSYGLSEKNVEKMYDHKTLYENMTKN